MQLSRYRKKTDQQSKHWLQKTTLKTIETMRIINVIDSTTCYILIGWSSYINHLLFFSFITFETGQIYNVISHYYIIGSNRPTFHFWDVIHQSDSFIAQHHCNARWITIWIQVDSVYKRKNHFTVYRKHPPVYEWEFGPDVSVDSVNC